MHGYYVRGMCMLICGYLIKNIHAEGVLLRKVFATGSITWISFNCHLQPVTWETLWMYQRLCGREGEANDFSGIREVHQRNNTTQLTGDFSTMGIQFRLTIFPNDRSRAILMVYNEHISFPEYYYYLKSRSAKPLFVYKLSENTNCI